MSRVDHPALREACGYALIGSLAVVVFVRARELREWACYAIHKAAELVPVPQLEDRERLFVVERDGTTSEEVQ